MFTFYGCRNLETDTRRIRAVMHTGSSWSLAPRQDLRNHSPIFDWGAAGSPMSLRQAAIAVLSCHLTDEVEFGYLVPILGEPYPLPGLTPAETLAVLHHETFAERILRWLPTTEWELTGEAINGNILQDARYFLQAS